MANNPTFFRDLVQNNLIDEWAENIDWLLNDKKFDKWNKNNKTHFTKVVKNLLHSNSIDYDKFKIDELKTLKPKTFKYAYINSNESEGIDLVRHIRNGIAHGNCNIKKNGDLYLAIIDYNSKNNVTARLSIPIDLIKNLRILYKKNIKKK